MLTASPTRSAAMPRARPGPRNRGRHTPAGFVAASLAGFVIGTCMADSGAAAMRTMLLLVLLVATAAGYRQRRRSR